MKVGIGIRVGLIVLVALVIHAGAVCAQSPSLHRLAVLDFQDRSSGAVTADEVLYLSDLFRGAMRRSLPAERYVLMTRENILELLPEGKTLAECIGDCAVQTGRNIGADHVVSGEVTAFAGEIRVTVNLHETGSGNLLGQVRAGAPTLLGVERDLETKTLDLLLPLRGVTPGTGTTGGDAGGATAPGSTWKAPAATKVVVSFATDPPGALVEIDGQPIGETPCRRVLPPGLYRVGFKKARHFPYEAAVDVAAGSAPSVSAKLEPDFGWITAESEPPGLTVSVDGLEVGRTPLVRWEAAVGPHQVTVAAPTHFPATSEIVVERGKSVEVRVTPVGRTGGLLVNAIDRDGNAVDAAVYSGGWEIGRTYVPLTLLRGRHELSIESPAGYWKGEVEIVEQELVEQAAELMVTPIVTIGDMKLVRVPAGSFTMGSPATEPGHDTDEAQHQVVITRPYLMSVTEVTQAQYAELVHANPSHYRGENAPVENVTWIDALNFCNLLSDHAGLPRAYVPSNGVLTWDRNSPGFRLPTSSEWEYACRAGGDKPYSSGTTEEDLKRTGWYKRNSRSSSHFVGAREPNAWGLYDMHGNVWEWCWDWLAGAPLAMAPGAEPQRDPMGPWSGEMRVWRGGSWEDAAKYCRSANIGGGEPGTSLSIVGFRVVRTVFD